MDSEFKIEKGIPLPPMRSQLVSARSTMSQMQIGDSFLCEVVKRPGIYTVAKVAGIKIACRVLDDGSNQMRVWRVA